MAEKRSAENDGNQPGKKHRFNSSSKSSKRHGHGVDETYGQRWAFGSLNATTVPNDDDLDWEDEGDALAYLKSVRQQAEGIPHVMIAQKAGPDLPFNEDGTVDRSIYEDGKGDFRGFYHDGAYTAYPDGYGEDEDPQEGEDEDNEDDPSETRSDESSLGGPRNSNSAEIQEAYFLTLTQKYQKLRDILQSKPPDKAMAVLSSSHPIDVGGFGASPSPFKQWSARMRNTDPLPAQIASMHKDSVLRLLRIILNGGFFRRGQELRERTSRWIWALLARLPEKGELDYQEIGWVRELGKRAVMFMLSLAEADCLQEQFGVGGNAASEDDGEVEVEQGAAEEASQNEDDEDGLPPAHGKEVAGDATPNENNTKPWERAIETKKVELQMSDGMQVAGSVPSPQSGVEMEIDSDGDQGKVSTTTQTQEESAADIEAAKARLLAQLDTQDEEQPDPSECNSNIASSTLPAPGETSTDLNDKATRANANLRATLNIILTVAGEFYGQRDLLEFRDPFGRAIAG